jgi:hypothetical protein
VVPFSATAPAPPSGPDDGRRSPLRAATRGRAAGGGQEQDGEPLTARARRLARLERRTLLAAGLADLSAPPCGCWYCRRLATVIDAAAEDAPRAVRPEVLRLAVRLAGALADVAHGLDEPPDVIESIEQDMATGALAPLWT